MVLRSPRARWFLCSLVLLANTGCALLQHDSDVIRPSRTLPATLDAEGAEGKTFPAVVLVHGGGGTAFDEWAELWAKRGYAAIAMDLAGCGPGRKRLPDGGPGQSDNEKFGAIDQPFQNQWTYHAVSNVILAHSLVRSFEEVDSRRTAVTGISWGGYLTCIVAGLDNRFKAAVPVYGCGFLHDNSVWLGRFAKMRPEQKDKWVQLWDPSMYVGSATMPVQRSAARQAFPPRTCTTPQEPRQSTSWTGRPYRPV